MEVKTIDNSIENLIITGMIVDSKFFRDVFRATKPEYFNAEVSKILVRWLREYYEGNNSSAPGSEMTSIFELNKNELDKDEETTTRIFLKRINQEYSGKEFNRDYILPKALKYLERNSLEYKTKLIVRELKRDNVEAAKIIFENATGDVFNEVSEWKSFSNIEIIHDWWDMKKESVLRFSNGLGEYMPSIERGRLYAMLGPAKRGKTHWLLEWAYNGVMDGLNVVIFSLEMSEAEIDIRWKTKISGKAMMNEESKVFRIPVMDCLHNQKNDCGRRECKSRGTHVLKNNIKSPFEENKDHIPCTECRGKDDIFTPAHWFIEEKIKRLTLQEAIIKQKSFDNHFGVNRVQIKSFPISTATVMDLERSLDELEMYKGFIPDLVIVDYADILKEDIKIGEKRHRVGDNWKQLSKMAKVRNIVVVTASQGNRSSAKKNRLDVDDVSEDFSKIMTIDGIFAINEENHDKTDKYQSDKYQQVQRIETIALRYGKFMPGLQCITMNDLERGQICIDSYIKWK